MCRADLNFEVDFWSKRRHWYDCDQVGSYCVRIMHLLIIYFFKYAAFPFKGKESNFLWKNLSLCQNNSI